MRGLIVTAIVSVAGCRATAPAVPAAERACPAGPVVRAKLSPPRPMIQSEHAGRVTALAVSPNGKTLATLGDDRTLRIWDLASRRLTRIVSRKDRLGDAVVWLDDDRIAFADGEVNAVVDRATGRDLAPTRDPVYAAGGGRWAYAAQGEDHRYKLVARDPASPALAISYTGYAGAPLISRDGRVVAIAEGEDQVELVAIRPTGELAGRRALPISGAPAMALSPHGDALYWGHDDRIVDALAPHPHTFAFTPRTDIERSTILDRREVAWWHESTVTSVAVSPGGDAIAGTNGPELVVWDIRTGKRRFHLDAPVRFADREWPPWLERVTWTDDGRWLIVADYDGALFLVDARTGRMQGRFGAPISHPMELHFLDDAHLAIRSLDRIGVWSLADAERTSSTPTHDALAIGATASGELAVAFGTEAARCGDGAHPIEIGAAAICLPYSEYAGLTDVDHHLVVGTPRTESGRREGRMSLLDPHGRRAISTCARPVAISQNGAVLVGLELDARTACAMDIATGNDLATIETPAVIEAIAVARDGSELAIASAGAVDSYALPSKQRVHHVELAAAATSLGYGRDHEIVAGLADGSVAVLRGDTARTASSPLGLALDVAVSPDGRRAVTAGFGAIVVWELVEAGPMVGAVLVDFADQEWLASTPNGAFAGTLEVGDRVGWMFDDTGEFFGLEASPGSRDPALVIRRLRGEDVDLPAIARPPSVAIVDAHVAGAVVHVRVHASSPGRVERVRAYVEGKPAAETQPCTADADGTLEVALGPGTSTVTVIAFDELGRASNPAHVEVEGPASAARPDIWVVAIGVDRYPKLGATMQLGVATADARAIAAAFGALAGPDRAYAHAHVETLVDAAATPAAIAAALERLAAMHPGDVGIVFLGGHGLKPSASADMVFATGAIDERDPRTFTTATIGWTRIGAALARAPGRILLLLDACHAGHLSQDPVLPNDALAADLVRVRRAGVVVFGAAKGRQSSYEPSGARGFALPHEVAPIAPAAIAPGHGLFTGAVLGSLASAATDRNDDGRIELQELVDDVTARVATATRGLQTPWVARREIFGDFSLAPIVRR